MPIPAVIGVTAHKAIASDIPGTSGQDLSSSDYRNGTNNETWKYASAIGYKNSARTE